MLSRNLPPLQDYLKKEDYGKVPKYLQNIKQDLLGLSVFSLPLARALCVCVCV